jgi:transposase
VISALMYVANNGIKWRAMSPDFPWQTAYAHFRHWLRQGVWEQINQALNRQGGLAQP